MFFASRKQVLRANFGCRNQRRSFAQKFQEAQTTLDVNFHKRNSPLTFNATKKKNFRENIFILRKKIFDDDKKKRKKSKNFHKFQSQTKENLLMNGCTGQCPCFWAFFHPLGEIMEKFLSFSKLSPNSFVCRFESYFRCRFRFCDGKWF